MEINDEATERWFLTPEERGNPSTDIDRVPRDDGRGWVAGNQVRPVLHGANYFRRLHDELCALEPGDRVYFTDWCGDADERLLPDGPTVGETLSDLAKNGVEVRGLIWRSHSKRLSYNAQQNEYLGNQINEAGGEVLLDQRIRRFGSHHQKLFVIQHQSDDDEDVAFVGGIDLCHGRRDDAEHLGDPQTMPMDKKYGEHPPWHDAAIELRGPIVGDLLRTFVERWDDPTPLDRRTPYRIFLQRRADMPRHPTDLPQSFPDPEPKGPHAVQVLRTYGSKRPQYPFARHGERSIARAYEKAFARARSLIYVEDQYLWSGVVAAGIADALKRAPDLRVIAVVPRYPRPGHRHQRATPAAGPAEGDGDAPQRRAGPLRRLRPGERGRHADLRPRQDLRGRRRLDDLWLGQLQPPVLDQRQRADLRRHRSDPGRARAAGPVEGRRRRPRAAPELRLDVWGEHLGRSPDDPELLDPRTAFELWKQTAADLDDWHAGGERGERPRGQARRHEPAPVGRGSRLWAEPAYRLFFDPDDRPRRMRRKLKF